MADLAEPLKRSKAARGMTIREMAYTAQLDQSQMSQWLNGASVSEKNALKLIEAGLVTRDEAADAFFGAEDAA